jgi:ribonuclease HI
VIEYLGFIIDSRSMTVTLTDRKKEKISTLGQELIHSVKVTIRQLSSFIGNIVAASPAVYGAPLWTKGLEIERNTALTDCCGNFDAQIYLSDQAKKDLMWWVQHIGQSSMDIRCFAPMHTVESDASAFGWGAVYNECQTNGHWDSVEASLHINELELKACLLALQSFCGELRNTSVLVKVDNTTAVACINRMGSIKPGLLKITKDIFQWALERNIHLMATHIPGSMNTIADAESRRGHMDTEWMLDRDVFQQVCVLYGTPEVDLFATRINTQLPRYVSYRPDPQALAVDAFSMSWRYEYMYIFAPFSLSSRILRKVEADQAQCLVILPLWPTRPWWTRALELLIDYPLLLPRQVLHLPQSPKEQHHLTKLRLTAMKLSGDRSQAEAFLQKLSPFSPSPGETGQSRSTGRQSLSGHHFVVKDKWIPFHHL